MHEIHTRNRADSRAFGNKKLILVMLERALSFPIMFILPFSLLAPGTLIQNLKRVDYWAMALLLTAMAVVGDLIVENGPVAQTWEYRHV